MNLLEHYIKHVYSVKGTTYEWGMLVEVDMDIDCCGHQTRTKAVFGNMEEWAKAEEQGYYLA